MFTTMQSVPVPREVKLWPTQKGWGLPWEEGRVLGLRKEIAACDLRTAKCGGVREEAEPGGGPGRSLTSACSWGSCRACTAPQSRGAESDLGTGPYPLCVCVWFFWAKWLSLFPGPFWGKGKLWVLRNPYALQLMGVHQSRALRRHMSSDYDLSMILVCCK